MPGFKINNTGGETSNEVETRRKHRWKFTAISDSTVSAPVMILLMSASRPHATIEEAEMHHQQEKVWFAGKYSWEPITLVFYDAIKAGKGGGEDVSEAMYKWFENVITVKDADVAEPGSYKKTATLEMLSGTGTTANETWKMFGAWPQDINWSDLDYTNTEIQKSK